MCDDFGGKAPAEPAVCTADDILLFLETTYVLREITWENDC